MIGGYWLFCSLKDPVLTALCGITLIPKAKMLSVFVVLGVAAVYKCLLDSDTPDHHLFYVFGSSLPNCSVKARCQWQWQQQ
eukprot:15336540-Ditylum_brightwellii.AAC.1